MNRLRGHGASVLVATLSSAFGVLLLQTTHVLSTAIAADDVTGSSATVGVLLAIVALLFIVISVYVGAIVTTNTFATIIAGRTREIALLRLIGSSARAQRRAVAREGLLVGVVGSGLGALIGTALAIGLTRMVVALDYLPSLDYGYTEPVVLLPVVAVALATLLASWVGSRRVLVVTPMQALGGAAERSIEELGSRRGRNAAAIAVFIVGLLVLLGGVVLGLVSPFGVLVAMVGGLLSFSGFIAGAHLVMPPALRLVGRALGRTASARLASENALRYPERSSRTTIGLVIGISLVTMFAVAAASFEAMIKRGQEAAPGYYEGVEEMLTATVVVFSVLIGFSALIAAVGMANNLSLNVLQRTRELGLLRALGFTAAQVRGMVRTESAQLTIAALLVGLVLGSFYGWAGAQSLLGGMPGMEGFVAPALPWAMLAVLAVASGLLTWAASVAPARRATRVSPVEALAGE